jgi:hypothetical protein
MPRLAILGSYPEGLLGITHEAETNGRWDAWRRGSNQPVWIWQFAEAELRATIRRYGFVNIYVYYGQEIDRNVEYVLRMDDFRLSRQSTGPPGPPGSACDESQTSKIWIKYTNASSLEHFHPKISRERFLQLSLRGSRFSEEPQPIDARAWEQMHLTGLIFVDDPQPSPRRVRGVVTERTPT